MNRPMPTRGAKRGNKKAPAVAKQIQIAARMQNRNGNSECVEEEEVTKWTGGGEKNVPGDPAPTIAGTDRPVEDRPAHTTRSGLCKSPGQEALEARDAENKRKRREREEKTAKTKAAQQKKARKENKGEKPPPTTQGHPPPTLLGNKAGRQGIGQSEECEFGSYPRRQEVADSEEEDDYVEVTEQDNDKENNEGGLNQLNWYTESGEDGGDYRGRETDVPKTVTIQPTAGDGSEESTIDGAERHNRKQDRESSGGNGRELAGRISADGSVRTEEEQRPSLGGDNSRTSEQEKENHVGENGSVAARSLFSNGSKVFKPVGGIGRIEEERNDNGVTATETSQLSKALDSVVPSGRFIYSDTDYDFPMVRDMVQFCGWNAKRSREWWEKYEKEVRSLLTIKRGQWHMYIKKSLLSKSSVI